MPKRNAANGDLATVAGTTDTPLLHDGDDGDAETQEEAEVPGSQSEAKPESVLPFLDEDVAEGNATTELFEASTTDEKSPCESVTPG